MTPRHDNEIDGKGQLYNVKCMHQRNVRELLIETINLIIHKIDQKLNFATKIEKKLIPASNGVKAVIKKRGKLKSGKRT